MFLSKIWFVIVAVLAAVAVTIALVVPRPAQRDVAAAEKQRLQRSCEVARILMKDNAWSRVQLANQFSAAMRQQLSKTLRSASSASKITAEYNATARRFLKQLVNNESISVSFVWVIDNRGRVVAREGDAAGQGYGDSVVGYDLVAEALDGFVRDDLWSLAGQLFRVAAAPVFDSRLNWSGAVIIGHAVDTDFAKSLSKQTSANIGFYVGETNLAASEPIAIHKEIAAHAATLADDADTHCAEGDVITIRSGSTSYSAVAARLPGEAGYLGAFYSVFVPQERGAGFWAALSSVKANDVSFGNFPWIRVILVLLVLVGVGMALMIFEVDKPIKQLSANAIALAKGETPRLDEDKNRGKLGSIARSVNIAIDKTNREAKAAKKDLDQLLGPAPDAAAPAGFDASASALPAIGTGLTPPPPSEFAFSDSRTPPPPVPSDNLVTPPPSVPLPEMGNDALASLPADALDEQALEAPTNERVIPKPVTLPEIKPRAVVPSAATPSPSLSNGNQLPVPNKNAVLNAPPPAAAVASIDDDILGSSAEADPHDDFADDPATQIFDGGPPEAESTEVDEEENYFRTVYAEFVEVKERCGESTASLNFDKFAQKLRSNRDALMAKHNCAGVKFQVYVRDGKAALKASPVRN